MGGVGYGPASFQQVGDRAHLNTGDELPEFAE